LNRFDITKGQPKAWSILARAKKLDRVASTYLFHGPEGVGAWSLALEFAALLNCEEPGGQSDRPAALPCGECRNCRAILNLNFEGMHLIVPIPSHKNLEEAIDLTNATLDRKREEPFSLPDRTRPIGIPIELAREVKRRLVIRGMAGVTRVVLFYQMETMRVASADALLKMIEEPPPDTVIILTAVRPEGLSPTILSRAQKIRLERLPETMVVEYLMAKHGATETAARLMARVYERSLGRAIESARGAEGEESDERSVGLMLFKTLMTEPASELVAQMSGLLNFNNRGAAENLVRLWQSLIRDGAYLANTSDEASLVNVDFASEIRQISSLLSDPAVVDRMALTTKNTLADLSLNVHIQPALVAMVLKLKADMKASAATDG